MVSYCLAPVSSCSPLIPITGVVNRVLTVTGLIPRTSYNIAISADTLDLQLDTYAGQFSTPLTAETAVPEGEYGVLYKLVLSMFSESFRSWFLLEGYVILTECCS